MTTIRDLNRALKNVYRCRCVGLDYSPTCIVPEHAMKAYVRSFPVGSYFIDRKGVWTYRGTKGQWIMRKVATL